MCVLEVGFAMRHRTAKIIWGMPGNSNQVVTRRPPATNGGREGGFHFISAGECSFCCGTSPGPDKP